MRTRDCESFSAAWLEQRALAYGSWLLEQQMCSLKEPESKQSSERPAKHVCRLSLKRPILKLSNSFEDISSRKDA